jgi:hypothetical protein
VRASDIVRQFCSVLTAEVQRARKRLMLALVDGLLRSQRLTLTALGRALDGKASPKHRIK